MSEIGGEEREKGQTINPHPHILKAPLARQIIHHNRGIRASDIHGRHTPEPLLPRGVPDLESDTYTVDGAFFRHEERAGRALR